MNNTLRKCSFDELSCFKLIFLVGRLLKQQMDLWTQSRWHKHQESQAEIQPRHLQLDYEQGKALFSMNNSLHNPIKPSHALHKNTFPIFLIRAYRVLAKPALAQVKKKKNSIFAASLLQDVMILMTGSHRRGCVSRQEMTWVKHVPSPLINSSATCCHLAAPVAALSLPCTQTHLWFEPWPLQHLSLSTTAENGIVPGFVWIRSVR